MMPTPLWEQQARQWSRIKPPLRPSGEDLVWAQESIDRRRQRQQRPLRALVLGATAELASLHWPEDSEVTAMDLSDPMLQGVWMAAPAASGRRHAIEGNWLNMPFPAGSFHLVFGDGSFSLVRQSEGRALAQAVRRVLRTEGELSLRAYVRPDQAESPEAVCDQLLAGRIGSFHIFKFRLLMALQRGAGEVWVADAWEAFHASCPPADEVASRLGWAMDEVTTLESYRGQSSIYWFPTLAEFRAILEPDFIEEACLWPTYELGERCPTFVLRPRN
jgi:SAM-dependent methyltransferase